jgi:Na+-driven multidrug efflux pump
LLLHLTTIQRALGSSKTPVSLLVGANVANLVLAVLLVYGPGPAPDAFAWAPPIARFLGIPRLELMGAAWATIAARLLALIPATWIVIRRFGLFRRTTRTRPDLALVRSIVGIAWPTSAQLVVRILAMLSVHSMVARAFTTNADQSATTALGIVFRLETMALFVALGWGSAAQSFMGWNLGAKDGPRAKRSGYYAAAYGAGTLLLLGVAYVAFGGVIVRFFDAEPTVVETGIAYLTVIAPSYVALGVAIVLGSAMQGAGATRQTLLLDLGLIFGLMLPLAVAVVIGGGSAERLWQCIAVSNWVQALVYFASYRRGAYLDLKL